jgi:GAF domain-containing protein
MMYEPAGHLLIPVDAEAPQRVLRLRELGLGDAPDPEFDEFARTLAASAGTAFAMVNFIDTEWQYYAGLYPAAGAERRAAALDRGWCPHVVVRRLPLVLDDVCDYPRFAGNPVVDEVGIRTYVGAPLIDRTGTVLGTVCVSDREPRPWGRAGLEFIKAQAADLIERIHQREPAQ